MSRSTYTYHVFFDDCLHVFIEVNTQAPQDTVAIDVYVFILKQTCQQSLLHYIRQCIDLQFK